MWGRAQKRNYDLWQHFRLGKSCPSAVSLMPDNSVPPHMSLMTFNLLLWCWSSEEVSPSKSVHELFKRNCLGLQKLLSPTASIPSSFYSQKLWRFIFLALEPWTGVLVWGWDPWLLRCTSQFLSTTHWCGISPFHISTPPTSLNVVSSWIFVGSSCRTSILLNCCSSGWWLFYSLVVISMWLCTEASHVYLPRHLGWKSKFNLKYF